ncbi:MAG TPA: serine hydrolase [Pirellula sp.]|nr:serine hydrolase [Pirellula sp.]
MKKTRTYKRLAVCLALVFCFVPSLDGTTPAQDKSVRPGINTPFQKPTPSEFLEKFEVESREIFAKRNEIVSACKVSPGMTIADIGAGTGLFTRLLAKATGPKGNIVAVDIAQSFLDHILESCKSEKISNVSTRLCNQESCLLAPNSVDLAFVCDTYHHFEYPFKTMTSIHKALKPDGKLVLIDIHRIPGVSSDWALNHLRADRQTFESEIVSCGFVQSETPEFGLKENYFTVFRKAASAAEVPCNPAIKMAMESFVAKNDVAGVVTMVVTPATTLHLDATGLADLAKKTPMRTDSIHWIASMSKPITAASMMMLVDQGKVALEDPISKYLPEMAGLKTATGQSVTISIEQLLNHTSGMSELPAGEAYTSPTLAVAAEKYAKLPVLFEPGTKWQYSQTSINTAAGIIEVVSGKSFDVFVDERLCKPLGMKDTSFYLSEAQMTRLAKSYTKEPDGNLKETTIRLLSGKKPTDRDRMPAGNGGLFSTIQDYAVFCQMLLNEGKWNGQQILSERSVNRLQTPTTGDLKTGFTLGNCWGVGCCVVREPQGVSQALSAGSFGHGGAYGTQAWIDPVRKRAYLIMVQRANFTNSDDSDLRKAFQKLATE